MEHSKHYSNFCHPYPSVYFETLNTTLPYSVNSAMNVLLAITTTFANCLVAVSIRRTTSIHLPSKLLLYSLILTDLGVGSVVQPQFAGYLIAKANKARHFSCFFLKSYVFCGSMFSAISLFTMTVITVDRYIALFRHLEYRETVTVKRVSAVVIFSWSCAILYALTMFWNNVLWLVLTLLGLFICFFVISVAHVKICQRLRHQHGHRVQDQAATQVQQAGITLNVARYQRAASAMLWIYAFFIICYLPYICALSVDMALQQGALTLCIRSFCYTLLLLKSLVNPLVYCFRLPEIRAEVLRQLLKICSHSQQ